MKTLILLTSLALSACGQNKSDQLHANQAAGGVANNETLYVASGSCYAGGVATSTGSQTIAAFDPASGSLKRIVADYGTSSPGDMPVSIAEYDASRLLVTIENASGRRIDLVNKDGSGYSTYITNSTALSGVLRAAKFATDGSLLVSKSTAIEKFAASKARLTQIALPWVNAPASSCATATTLISGLDTLASGKIVFAHAAATPNNRIDVISSSGYASTADCLGSIAAPTTLAMPTAVLTHSSGQVLASYGSTTASSNFVYSYPIDSGTGVIGTAVAAFNDMAVVNGPSALAEDALTPDVYVANSLSTMNTIERFTYNMPAGTLTRNVSGRIGPNLYTRCVTAIKAIREN